jgi:hypothetical protein
MNRWSETQHTRTFESLHARVVRRHARRTATKATLGALCTVAMITLGARFSSAGAPHENAPRPEQVATLVGDGGLRAD